MKKRYEIERLEREGHLFYIGVAGDYKIYITRDFSMKLSQHKNVNSVIVLEMTGELYAVIGTEGYHLHVNSSWGYIFNKIENLLKEFSPKVSEYETY